MIERTRGEPWPWTRSCFRSLPRAWAAIWTRLTGWPAPSPGPAPNSAGCPPPGAPSSACTGRQPAAAARAPAVPAATPCARSGGWPPRTSSPGSRTEPAMVDGPAERDRELAFCGSEVDAARGEPRRRVQLLAAGVPDLEVQVRAGGVAAVAHPGDLLAGLDRLALFHREAVHVAVHADRAVGVLDAYPESEAAGRAGLDHDTVGDRADRRADPVRDVHAVVSRAPPLAEAGGEGAVRGLDELAERVLLLQAGGTGLGDPGGLGHLLGLDRAIGGPGHGEDVGRAEVAAA